MNFYDWPKHSIKCTNFYNMIFNWIEWNEKMPQYENVCNVLVRFIASFHHFQQNKQVKTIKQKTTNKQKNPKTQRPNKSFEIFISYVSICFWGSSFCCAAVAHCSPGIPEIRNTPDQWADGECFRIVRLTQGCSTECFLALICVLVGCVISLALP